MEKYVYKYADAYGVERQLSIDYYDEFTYYTYEYYDATFESEPSPDWGINIFFQVKQTQIICIFIGVLEKVIRFMKNMQMNIKRWFRQGIIR